MCFINYIEMARVTGVPFNYLLARGQSIKVLSQLFRKANDDGYVIPALKGEGTRWFPRRSTVPSSSLQDRKNNTRVRLLSSRRRATMTCL